MQFIDAVSRCKVRGYIARESKPDKKYAKNHSIRLVDRVPMEDQKAIDWDTFDPENIIGTSIIG